MARLYDRWWGKGENGDQEMEQDHYESWQNVINLFNPADIKQKDILDFGCNQGGLLRHLYQRIPYTEAYGIDLARKSIAIAQKRAKTYPITFVLTDNPTTLNKLFDTVISTSVLYLIENLNEHFSLINQVLKAGGIYYATFTDHTKNPSVKYMQEKIDQYAATKMQNKSLDEVVDALLTNGFSVKLINMAAQSATYDVTNYKEFYLSVSDYILSYNNYYLIKATKSK